jgi:hypothetical protein
MRTLAGMSLPSASCNTLLETTFDCVLPGMRNIPFSGRCVIIHALSGILSRTSANCRRSVATSSLGSPLGSPALLLSTTNALKSPRCTIKPSAKSGHVVSIGSGSMNRNHPSPARLQFS